MARSNSLADKLGAVGGIATAVLLFLGVAAVDPQRGVSDQEMLDWWADGGNRDGFVFSMYALLLACPFFLVFVGRLRTRLRGSDSGGWADTVYAFGIVATTALGVCAVTRGAVAKSVRFADEPVPGVDTLRFTTDLAVASWDLVILFAALVVAITAVLSLANHVLPRWHGWLGVAVSAGCVILLAAQVASFSLPLLNIWLIATGIQMLRDSAVSPVDGAAWHPQVSSVQA